MLLECQSHGKSQKRRLESSLPHSSFAVGCIVIYYGMQTFSTEDIPGKIQVIFTDSREVK